MLPWLFILSIFPLLGFVGGRLFCGWLCPEGALFELYDFLTGKLIGRKSLFSKGDGATAALGRVGSVKRALYAALALSCMIVIPVLAGIGLTGFFINPRAIWTQIIDMELSGGLKAGVIGVFIYMTATGLVVRHTFCKYVCAAGLMQTLFGWISPVSVRVRFQKENISRCTDCKGCERACFMDIKPRTGRRDISCVNCGECINACRRELGEGCLFNYTIGEKGNIDAAPYARSGQSDVALRNTRPI
jgi:polyferredoxin